RNPASLRAPMLTQDGRDLTSFARAHPARGADRENLPRRAGSEAAPGRKTAGLPDGLDAAGTLARARPRPTRTGDARRPGHRDFLERQHRQPEGGPAHTLQHWLEHRAGRPDLPAPW